MVKKSIFRRETRSVEEHLLNQKDGINQKEQTRSRYHDLREKFSATITFEWSIEESRVYNKDYLNKENLYEETNTGRLDKDVVDINNQQILIEGLKGMYIIQRTPQLTCLHMSKEVPYITRGMVRKFDRPLLWDCYYLGETGEIIIYVSRDLNDAKVHFVDVSFAGHNGFGLPCPFGGPLTGDLIFLAGVFPLRLLSAEISDWKLISVDEQEWVFDLHPDQKKRQMMRGMLSFDQVLIYLNRKRGDAPAQAEIVAGSAYERWKTLAYKQVRGVWIPSRIMLEYKVATQTGQLLFELVHFTPTRGAVIEVPQGIPVRDWRQLGRMVWERRDERECQKATWGSELLGSIWRQLRSHK